MNGTGEFIPKTRIRRRQTENFIPEIVLQYNIILRTKLRPRGHSEANCQYNDLSRRQNTRLFLYKTVRRPFFKLQIYNNDIIHYMNESRMCADYEIRGILLFVPMSRKSHLTMTKIEIQ